MIDFGGLIYYIDFKALDKAICSDDNWKARDVTDTELRKVYDENDKITGSEILEKTYYKGKEIDGPKYDIIRVCIEVIMDYNEELDTSLGADRALDKIPLSVKLAFNTLIKEKILVEVDAD